MAEQLVEVVVDSAESDEIWHKIAALILFTLQGTEPLSLLPEDVAMFEASGCTTIVLHEEADHRLVVQLVDDAEADKMERRLRLADVQ